MVRDWVAAGFCLLATWGCGARTELLVDYEVGDSTVLEMRCELEGDDPRIADIAIDELTTLDAANFVSGPATRYEWSMEAEDCDAVVRKRQVTLKGANQRLLRFQPSRPATYHLKLEAFDASGRSASCNLSVPVRGVGMRVELCWDTNTTTDLDLYLHNPTDREPWYSLNTGDVASGLNNTTANNFNTPATVRSTSRVDWGYPDSPLTACQTPAFRGFIPTGRCPNPRAAEDNNQQNANGTTERMQLDNPRNGETFRVMVQNFNNQPARPLVIIYCGGEKVASFDAPPQPSNFFTANPGIYGVMWRAADVTTSVDATGKVSCRAAPVTPNAVTIDDFSF